MKRLLTAALILLSLQVLHARGPWSEYAESPPPAGSPAAVTGVYVQIVQQGDLEACRKYMVPSYAEWLESLGGLESALDVFLNANLQKRFAWRQSIDGNSATVWVRVHVITRGREVNVALNLVKTSAGWRLTK